MNTLFLIGLVFLGWQQQAVVRDDHFEPLRFLIGVWQGSGSGQGGESLVSHQFEEIFEGKYIRWQSRMVFSGSAQDRGAQDSGETHEGFGFFSFDPSRQSIVFRQFLSEGIVNTYLVTQKGTGRLVLTTEHSEGSGGKRARLRLESTSKGSYRCELSLAQAGGDFVPFRSLKMAKLDPENWLKGLDVSHYSGVVDWDQVKQGGYHFAFVKATEGEDWVDPTFARNMEGIKNSGLKRGAYHFFVAHDDPEVQARHFIQQVKLSSGDLPPVVDIETLSSRPVPDLPVRLKKWLTLVEDHYGVKPIIYTSPRFWNNQVKRDFSNYPVWVAEYKVDLPTLPKGWNRWILWQYDGAGTPGGVQKTADLNYFNGNSEALKRLLIP